MSEVKIVACNLCKKDIPESVALTSEGADYILHFCSTDCMDHYFKQHPDETGREKVIRRRRRHHSPGKSDPPPIPGRRYWV